MSEIQTTVATAIKSLIPVEQFKKGFYKDYDMIVNIFAEDVVKRLPKDHSIEVIEENLFIVKKDPELEGYDRFVKESKRTIFTEDEKIPFDGYLEDFINATGRNVFFK